MKTFGKFTRIAIATAVAGAVALPASGALAASKTERALIGALIGGVAGVAISKNDTSGALIGAGLGAALGAATAKSNNNRYGYNSTYYGYGR